MRVIQLMRWTAAGAGALALAGCGHTTSRTADVNGCAPAPIHTGRPPGWTASAWSDASPGFRAPYALATGESAAAFLFAQPLRAGHPTNPANKVLWVMRYPRDGKPLVITARWSAHPSVSVRISRAADSSPGEIYPTYVDLPKPGCWTLALRWGTHRASIDLHVLAAAARPSDAPSFPARAPTTVPGPLHGVPLVGPTGLRLLISADPPVLLDLDTGAVTPVTGLNVKGNPVLSVTAVGNDAVLWLDRHTGPTPHAEIYVVRHGSTRARRIATGWEVAPADGGQAIWLLSFQAPHRCALSRIGLDGNTQKSPRSVPCSTRLIDAGSQTVLINHHMVADAATGHALLRTAATDTLWSIADGRALTSTGQRPPLALIDLRNGARERLPWPTQIAGTSQSGADQAVVQPHGRLIALDFVDPAYHLTGTQLVDVWLLDPATRRFLHVPDMPAAVHIKLTSIAWTREGRLIMLAQTGEPGGNRNLVAIWKPGQRQLAIRPIRLPARTNGSPTFVTGSRRPVPSRARAKRGSAASPPRAEAKRALDHLLAKDEKQEHAATLETPPSSPQAARG